MVLAILQDRKLIYRIMQYFYTLVKTYEKKNVENYIKIPRNKTTTER